MFVNGLTAKDAISWNGNNVTVDSYNSDNGTYASQIPNDNGSVASNAIIEGAISSGNGDIYGYVATGGGEPNFGPSGSLTGKDTPLGTQIDLTRIAYDFYAEFENMEQPVGDASTDPPIPSSGTIGNPSHTVAVDYYSTGYSNSSSDVLTIDGPVRLIVDGDWSSKGEIKITSNGSVELYITGNLHIGGIGTINMSDVPSNFFVVGTNNVNGAKTIKMSGNGAIKAAIYAPNANLEMKGGGNSGTFMGAAVANTIIMTGNSNFHYDEALGSFTTESKYRVARWRELIDSDEKVPMDQPSKMVAYAIPLY